MEFQKTITNRGFELLHFKDCYDELCDIQRSSSAEDDYIWLGIHDPHPLIMASRTSQGGNGWVDYPIPDDVLIHHRMHLNRARSIALALKLLKFGLFNRLN